MRKILLAGILAFFLPNAEVQAQCSGIFSAGNVCANPSAAGTIATSTTLTALLDRALCGTNGSVPARVAGVWTCQTPSAILDTIGSTRGSVLYRGAAGWTALTPGTANFVLTSQGAGADPIYAVVASSGFASGTVVVSAATLTFSGTHVSKQTLMSNTGSAPMTATLPGSGVGVLASGSIITVTNQDASQLLQVVVGAGGTTLDGTTTRYVVLGPLQSATFLSNGTNYFTVIAPNRARIVKGVGTTLYVAATGSDNNSCILVASPCATRQHLVDVVQQEYDVNGSQIILKLTGNFTDTGVTWRGRPPGVGNSSGSDPFYHAILITGDTGTPSNVTITTTGGGTCWTAGNGATFHLTGVKLVCDGDAISAGGGGTLLGLGVVDFGATVGNHLHIINSAGIHLSNDYSITGNAARHMYVENGGLIYPEGVNSITLAAGRTFASGFAVADSGGTIDLGGTATFTSIVATATRWSELRSGKILVNARDKDTIFPGNVAGSSFWVHKYVLTFGNQNAALTTGATHYFGPTGASATEVQAQIRTFASRVVALSAHSNVAPAGADTYTITFRVNGADSTSTCTITGAATVCSDTTHTVTVALFDLINIKAVSSATATTSAQITVLIAVTALNNSESFP